MRATATHSQLCQQTFGYSKEEMEGKNVKMLMPSFFAQRHDGYLRRYVATGAGSCDVR